MVDAECEQRDLTFCRAGVLFRLTMLLENLLFFFLLKGTCEYLCKLFLCFPEAEV